MKVKRRLYFFLYGIIFLLNSPSFSQITNLNHLQKVQKNVETYFWLGMYEDGNPVVFQRGLDEIESCLPLANSADSNSTLLKNKFESLRNDIENQLEFSQKTFSGQFPLAKLFDKMIFEDPEPFKTFELFENPEISAIEKSARKLATVVENFEMGSIQYDLVILDKSPDHILENKALYIFNKSPQFFISPLHSIVGILSSEEMSTLNNKGMTPSILNKIIKYLGKDNFLLITFDKINETDKIFWYELEAKVYSGGQNNALHNAKIYTLVRDSRNSLFVFIFLYLGCLLCLTISILVYRKKFKREKVYPNDLVGRIISFYITGTILPWLIVGAYSTLRPEVDNSLPLSIWWAGGFGFACFIMPGIVIKIFSSKITSLGLILKDSFNSSFLLFAFYLGIASYLYLPILLFFDLLHASSIIILLLPIVFVFSHVLNRNLAQKSNASSILLLSLLTILWGIVFLHANADLIIALHIIFSIIGLITLGWVYKKRNKIVYKYDRNQIIENSPQRGELNLDYLSKLAINPPFYTDTNSFKTLREKVIPIFQKRSIVIHLLGENGVGKTASANQIIKEIEENAKKLNIGSVVLAGRCPQQINNQTSQVYSPFIMAFQKYINFNEIEDHGHQRNILDKTFENILESIIPFSGFLIPSSDSNDLVMNKMILMNSILKTMNRLKKDGLLILFIDDIQWVDEASKDVINYLIRELNNNEHSGILVILNSRDDTLFFDAGNKIERIQIDPLSEKERRIILEREFHLHPDVVTKIFISIGSNKIINGDLFWLFHIIKRLIQMGALEKVNETFYWSKIFQNNLHIPVPVEFSDSISRIFDENTKYYDVFAIMACIGMELDINVLCKALKKSRFDTIKLISEIIEKTGFLFEVRSIPNTYCFTSSFLLEVIRQKLNIKFSGVNDLDISILTREYHGLAAKSLSSVLGKSRTKEFEIANNYYAAGYNYFEMAVQGCFSCARIAMSLYEFNQAKEYLAKANECVKYLNKEQKYKLDLLLIECEMSHLEGANSVNLADKCSEYSRFNADIPVPSLLVFARTCYEAGTASGNQDYFNNGIEMCKSALAKIDSNFDKAQCLQLIGMCISNEELIEKKQYLENAFGIIKGETLNKTSHFQLYASICDSLGSCLVRMIINVGDEEIENRLLSLYEESVKIKLSTNDLLGLARSYGSLGRYFFFKPHQEITKAREYFMKDLEIAIRISDKTGIAQMNSMIGDCDLLVGEISSALKNFNISFENSERLVDKIFSLIGMIDCYINLDEYSNVSAKVVMIEKTLINNSMPTACHKKLARVLCKVNVDKCDPRLIGFIKAYSILT